MLYPLSIQPKPDKHGQKGALIAILQSQGYFLFLPRLQACYTCVGDGVKGSASLTICKPSVCKTVMFRLSSFSFNLFCTLVAYLLPIHFDSAWWRNATAFSSSGNVSVQFPNTHFISLSLSVWFWLDSFRSVLSEYLNWLSCAKVVNPCRAPARVLWKQKQWVVWSHGISKRNTGFLS